MREVRVRDSVSDQRRRATILIKNVHANSHAAHQIEITQGGQDFQVEEVVKQVVAHDHVHGLAADRARERPRTIEVDPPEDDLRTPYGYAMVRAPWLRHGTRV